MQPIVKRAQSVAADTPRQRSLTEFALLAGKVQGATLVMGALTVAVYVLTSIPYLIGYMAQTETMRFTGIVFDVVDTAQYFAWMRSFSDSLLIANPLTPEPGSARFFNLQWWLLGLLAHHTPLGDVVTYQLLRIVSLVAFGVTLAWFCKLVIPRHRVLAFAIVMLSSGLGWIWVVEKQWSGELRHPLDVQMAEPNTFFSAMAFPHLLLAAAMMLTIFCLALNLHRSWSWRGVVALVAMTLALGFSHGYDLIPTMAIPGATAAVLLLQQKRIPGLGWAAAIIVAASVPGALYALSLTHLDATWSGVLSQYGNAGVFTPPPHRLLVLMGLPLILAVAQLRPAVWRGIDERGMFLRVWLVVGFVLAYIPTDYQIKMLTGYQIPVGILATFTVIEVAGWARGRFALRGWYVPAGLVAFIGVLMLTNLYLTSWRMLDLNRTQYPYFLTQGDVSALQRLDELAAPGDVVLSSPDVGVFVPVYSDARPYVAHWAQTLRYFERRDIARWFYADGTAEADRQLLLLEHDISFVVHGQSENLLSQRSSAAPVLSEFDAVHVGTTMIYKIDQPSGSGSR